MRGGAGMARTVGIGIQDYARIIENNHFYVDKTSFIKEWWESGDEVTLITRPRRFGKTLNMSFTEEEVFAAMDEQGMPETEKEKVKFWFDGFTFGRVSDIYNPWSVTMYLDKGIFDTYWADTSGNGLVGRLIREGDKGIKTEFEKLLNEEYIEAEIDEQIIFSQLSENRNAIWGLLLASGYLKVVEVLQKDTEDFPVYRLGLTNFEVRRMFRKMVKGWFEGSSAFNEFTSAMFRGDVRSMNHYMNKVALDTFSYFDTGKKPSEKK